MNDTPYLLGADVEVVRRQSTLLLFSRRSGQSVRVSPLAVDLLPLLTTGSTFVELQSRLQRAHPRAGDVGSKLMTFLTTLSDAGVLTNGEASAPRRTGSRKIPLGNPDALAKPVAGLLAKLLPGRSGVVVAWLMALAAVAAIASLAWSGGLPRLRDMVEFLDWRGVLLFFLVVIPIHEFAHAVACRRVGVPVSEAGLILHGGFFPGPYVDTSKAYQLTNRWRRFVIPAAGPFVNLVSAGLVAAWLQFAAPPGELVPVLQGLLLACLMFVYFDTNPLTASDGSHCIEAGLDDELARHYALGRPQAVADPAIVRRYRIITLMHLLLSAALFWTWWQ
jgi:putative peptide zinc metalloprotease protein